MVIITNTSIQFDFPGMNPRKYLFKGNPLLNCVPGYNRFTTTFIYVLKILNLILLLYTSIGLCKSNAFHFSAFHFSRHFINTTNPPSTTKFKSLVSYD